MNKGIVPKLYKSLTEGLKMVRNAIDRLVSYPRYGKVNDVFNSKLECVGFISGSTALNLERRGVIEFKNDCCMLTDDSYLSEILDSQKVLMYSNEY